MTMHKDPFELFNLPKAFVIDLKALDKSYIALQAQFHPDKFLGATDREITLIMAQSSSINTAYQSLKDPLTRAKLLVNNPTDTHHPNVLMAMMELRETIEHTDDLAAVQQQVNARIKTIEAEFELAFQQQSPALNDLFYEMQYLYKAKVEIKNKILQ